MTHTIKNLCYVNHNRLESFYFILSVVAGFHCQVWTELHQLLADKYKDALPLLEWQCPIARLPLMPIPAPWVAHQDFATIQTFVAQHPQNHAHLTVHQCQRQVKDEQTFSRWIIFHPFNLNSIYNLNPWVIRIVANLLNKTFMKQSTHTW